MIELTHLNGKAFFLNPDLIVTVEATPDTLLSLHTGDRLMVKESAPEVARRFMEYKCTIEEGLAGKTRRLAIVEKPPDESADGARSETGLREPGR